jgi:Protein of unknown function, DUF
VGGYFVEGHVPADDIKRLLAEHPNAKGLAVPGIPVGSPGMEAPSGEVKPCDVLLVARDGSTSVFAHHEKQVPKCSGTAGMMIDTMCAESHREVARSSLLRRHAYPAARALDATLMADSEEPLELSIVRVTKASVFRIGAALKPLRANGEIDIALQGVRETRRKERALVTEIRNKIVRPLQ